MAAGVLGGPAVVFAWLLHGRRTAAPVVGLTVSAVAFLLLGVIPTATLAVVCGLAGAAAWAAARRHGSRPVAPAQVGSRWPVHALARSRVGDNPWQHALPGTRWGGLLDSPAAAAAELVNFAGENDLPAVGAGAVDLVAATIAADVWVEAYGLRFEQAAQAGPVAVRWLSRAAARAAGFGAAVADEGFAAVADVPADPTSGPDYQRWAVAQLGEVRAALALARAAADVEAACAGTPDQAEAARIVAALRWRGNALREGLGC